MRFKGPIANGLQTAVGSGSRARHDCSRMSAPSGIDTVLLGVSIALYLIVLFAGRQRLEIGGYFQTFLSVAGIVTLAVSVYLLGWPGVFILVGISLIAGLIRSVALAVKNEEILVSAQIHGAFQSREEALAFPKRLRASDKALRAIDPIELDRLIERLAVRGRQADEIERMAAPIAKLHIIFKAELTTLVDRFDQLMRLWGYEADQAIRAADKLTATTQASAASFEEILDSMIAFAQSGESNAPATR